MISRLLFKQKRPKPEREPSEVPTGTVVWAIGDVHGRLDLLNPLLDHILEDFSAADPRQPGSGGKPDSARKALVFLGDYVDRGLESRGVLDRLVEIAARSDIEARFLRGNHEEQMLAFLEDPEAGPAWCEYGGVETLESYGLHPPAIKHVAQAWVRVSADLNHALPRSHRDLLETLETSLSIGGYFFAHAGARPGVPLEAQSERDLLWIRGSFLDDDSLFEKVVVHGHTPSRDVHVGRRRIGVDTGVYKWNKLSAVRLEGQNIRIAQSRFDADGAVTVSQRDAQVMEAA